MDAVLTQDEYRLMETRPRLLAQWFERSRDSWKGYDPRGARDYAAAEAVC